ncbi:hypothetical protein F3Y22_tig00112530pilonHSYRG00240 [Hibiscus syriacus]|uniref:Reverse transcriptase Ty1/copia-type domain-containing protein n=1 Tax=Hibiscus syriacus TaxID=106335 RepID=A0A6A2WWC2_HIBSY|nr:hypothetical protein F3Y22_tig00112530pilonHSYRG00240 [Hibiscus syriacus]
MTKIFPSLKITHSLPPRAVIWCAPLRRDLHYRLPISLSWLYLVSTPFSSSTVYRTSSSMAVTGPLQPATIPSGIIIVIVKNPSFRHIHHTKLPLPTYGIDGVSAESLSFSCLIFFHPKSSKSHFPNDLATLLENIDPIPLLMPLPWQVKLSRQVELTDVVVASNCDDWIEYVKLNAGLLGLDLAIVMNEPTKLTDTSPEADKKLWENWERSNRLMMSFLKLSIVPNINLSQPKTENVRDFVAEIKKCTMTYIVDKSVVAALIDDLSNREEREDLKVKLPQANFSYCGNSNKWLMDMKEELKYVDDNNVWEMTELPKDSKESVISGSLRPNETLRAMSRCTKPYLLPKVVESKFIILVLYVDDILLATSDRGLLHDVKGYISSNIEMKDICEASYGRYQSNPILVHWRAAKKALRYLQGTKDHMLTYRKTSNLKVVGYSDSDYAGCSDTRKFTFGYVFLLVDGDVSWKSGKQSVIATSTMDAEFVACFEAIVQSLWLRNFVDDLGIVGTIAKPMRIYCDNTTTVFLSKNNRYSKGSKHMDLKYLSVKEEVQNQRVQILHIGTNDMIADLSTKGLALKTFIGHVSEIGVVTKSLYSG